MKTCPQCKEPFERTAGHGVHVYCSLPCRQAAGRERNRERLRVYSIDWYYKNKERVKGYHEKYLNNPVALQKRSERSRDCKYGKGASEHFKQEREKQKNLCAICLTPLTKPNLDHNHDTEQLRGVLCHGCNSGIGHLEKKGWLPLALNYLAKWGI